MIWLIALIATAMLFLGFEMFLVLCFRKKIRSLQTCSF